MIFNWLWRLFALLLMMLVPCIWLRAQYPHLGFKITDNRTSVTIPFEIHNNLIVIPIILNNTIPLKFVLDTGVRTAILTEKTYSDILQVSYDRVLSMFGADGVTKIEAYVATDISLRMPGVIGYGQALLVLREDYLMLKNSLGIDVHGILGYEVFSRFVVNINYSRKQLTLTEAGSHKVKKRFKEIPIKIEDTKPYVQTIVTQQDGSEIEAKLMMDTGASHSLLLNLSTDERLILPDPSVEGLLGRGLGGDLFGRIGRIKELRLGKYSFRKVLVSYPAESIYSEVFKQTGRQGTLGGGIISRFNVTFDYFQEKIYVRRNRGYRAKFEYNMSGIDLIADGPSLELIKINRLLPSSTAAMAGLEQGDIIKTINSRPIKDLDLQDVSNIFRSKNQKNIVLIVERNGQTIKKKFKLERIL